MSHRLPDHIIKHICEAMEAASLSNASFDGVSSPKTIIVTETWNGARPREFPSYTDLIRDKVKLHHGSWIIAPLQRILDWSESKDDGSQKEYDILGRLRAKWPNPAVLEEAHAEITNLRHQLAILEDFKRNVTGAVVKLNREVEC